MNLLPRISVVIPMYNSRSWINETLTSVFNQTYPRNKLEVLVLDDGSSDDSVEIASSFFTNHPINGTVITSDSNMGVSAARNRGWRQSSGEWIQFLDSDDILASNKIEIQAELAGETAIDTAVIYSPWQHIVNSDGVWKPNGRVHSSTVEYDTVTQILDDRFFGYVGPTIIRRSALEIVGGFNESMQLGEDIDLMLRIAMAGGGFRSTSVSDALFFYRQRPGSLWQQARFKVGAVSNLVRAIRKVEEFLRNDHPDEMSEKARYALVSRYEKRLDQLFEEDRQTFREALKWIQELGFSTPPGTSGRWRIISKLIGYEYTHALRIGYRRARSLLGRLLSKLYYASK